MVTKLIKKIRIVRAMDGTDEVRVTTCEQEGRTYAEYRKRQPWREEIQYNWTDAYAEGGQEQLDRAVLKALLTDTLLYNRDPSLTPYYNALTSKAAHQVFQQYDLEEVAEDGHFDCFHAPSSEWRGGHPLEWQVIIGKLSKLVAASRARQAKRRTTIMKRVMQLAN